MQIIRRITKKQYRLICWLYHVKKLHEHNFFNHYSDNIGEEPHGIIFRPDPSNNRTISMHIEYDVISSS